MDGGVDVGTDTSGEPDASGAPVTSVAAVYAAHVASLTRLAAVVCGDLDVARDLVQDAFADLVRAEQLQAPGAVHYRVAWLRRVVANRSISWVRRRMVARRHYLAQMAAGPPQKHSDPDGAATVAVRSALSRLGPEQRAVVFLRYYLDLSEAETARTLGIRTGTAKSRLSRAMVLLREELADD